MEVLALINLGATLGLVGIIFVVWNKVDKKKLKKF